MFLSLWTTTTVAKTAERQTKTKLNSEKLNKSVNKFCPKIGLPSLAAKGQNRIQGKATEK